MSAAVKAVKKEELVLRGPPQRLLGVVRLPDARAGTALAALDLPNELGDAGREASRFTHFRPLSATGLCRARMKLPSSTPPGTYRGVVDLDDGKLSFVAEVQPDLHLRVVPDMVTVEASQSNVETSLTLVNTGNVPFEIPPVAAFGLFSKGGLSQAIGDSFLAELQKGESRLDRLMDEFARSYGGVVKLKVRQGAGELAAGDARDLQVGLHLPGELTKGRRYWGDWLLRDAAFRVYVSVPERKSSDRRKKR